MKSYLRYEAGETIGLINAANCHSILLDPKGETVLTGGLERVLAWSLRTTEMVKAFKPVVYNPTFLQIKNPDLFTVIKRSPEIVVSTGDSSSSASGGSSSASGGGESSLSSSSSSSSFNFAAGTAQGEVHLYNFNNPEPYARLRGHRTSVLCIDYADNGKLLATGGADSDVIIWDAVNATGICRLRGHKDAVTGLCFFMRGEQLMLATVSKDTLMKIWDIETNHCVQTIVGHRCEIWCISVVKRDGADYCLLTGSGDDMIRSYTVNNGSKGDKDLSNDGNDNSMSMSNSNSGSSSDSSKSGLDSLLDDNQNVVVFHGSLPRRMTSINASSDKVLSIKFHEYSNLIAVTSSSKSVEIFKLRSLVDSNKKLKRRMKRQREKLEKQQSGASSSNSDVEAYNFWKEDDFDEKHINDEADNKITHHLFDDVERIQCVHLSQKCRGLDFSNASSVFESSSSPTSVKMVVATSNNTIEYFKLNLAEANSTTGGNFAEKISILDFHGHRSDVKSVTVSADGLHAATGSAEGIKLWNTRTYTCSRSCFSSISNAMCFVPGGRHLIVGTRDGRVQIVEIASDSITFESDSAHTGVVTGVSVRPDGTGFMTASEDKTIALWDFQVEEGRLTAVHSRTWASPFEVLCLTYSKSTDRSKLLLAAGLSDNTIKIVYDDSLKFFLSLYGHSLPVTCLDISTDGSLLISGSVDKTVKIWGLDFGDCHRSLLVGEDAITAVKFQPSTHLFFTSSKDGCIKYYDGDRFEQILLVGCHSGICWGLDISYDASFVVSVSQDRSIKIWIRSEDLCFIEEEKEKYLDSQVETQMQTTAINMLTENAESGSSAVTVTMPSVDSYQGADAIIEAMDVVEQEIVAIQEYYAAIESASKTASKTSSSSGGGKQQSQKPIPKRVSNPLLLQLTPHKYFLRVLRQIRLSDLEAAIMALSLHNSIRLLKLLVAVMKKGFDIELTIRCSILLLKNHWKNILTNNVSNNNSEVSVLSDIESLHQDGMFLMNQYRELVGVNLQGLKFLSHFQIEKSTMKSDDSSSTSSDGVMLPSSSLSAAVAAAAGDIGISAANTYDEYLEKRSELGSGGGGAAGSSSKKRKNNANHGEKKKKDDGSSGANNSRKKAK